MAYLYINPSIAAECADGGLLGGVSALQETDEERAICLGREMQMLGNLTPQQPTPTKHKTHGQ